MASLNRVKCVWTGLQGLPGVNTWFFDASTPMTGVLTALGTFYSTIAVAVGCGWTVTIPSSGDSLNDTDGAITGAWGGVAPAAVGSSSGVYAGGCGLVVGWGTGAVVHRRRVQGRTNIVPIASSVYQSDGTIAAAAITAVDGAAATFLTAVGSAMKIWARPFAGTVGNPARVGSSAVVTTHQVPDHVCTLRSRRY